MDASRQVPIRLMVSDVDGTLVRPDKSIAEATVAAVRRLGAAGVPMTLISARPPSGMIWIAELLGIESTLGAFNGGTLIAPDGRLLSESPLAEPVSRAAVERLDRPGVSIWVFAGGHWYATDPNEPHIPREIRSTCIDPIIMSDLSGMLARADKIVGVSDDDALLGGIEAELQASWGEQATIARSQPYYLDITHRAANKGDGVAALAAAAGVALDEVAVIGDMANDLPMFARAGLSIAMGQAPDRVRRAADIVTVSNAEDGVAHAIDQFVLPRIARAA
ncbi:hydrolase Cof [Sphingomonas oleivorans]|uniref:Hydrolase Cof n=1 Tax=Sphingomonas oleivorans TaxID=1735121 RepID=A0A2T5FWM3_9SPHN|nr:Cof-type HAD-IIB family hydrolase [Sphingomonas oleivorans]PTQ10180.1 hydrolase Cof [Sphingomonas oleivorans]